MGGVYRGRGGSYMEAYSGRGSSREGGGSYMEAYSGRGSSREGARIWRPIVEGVLRGRGLVYGGL